MSQPTELQQHISSLLDKANLSPDILAIEACTNGGNNRTFKVSTKDGLFAVKKYFRQPGDTRDRLTAEFSFLSYANTITPEMVPIPYSQDQVSGMALYEYVDGTPLKGIDITRCQINQASEFFCALNASPNKVQARELPNASEACFSLREHLDLVSDRIQKLTETALRLPEDKAAEKCIKHLDAYWCSLAEHIKKIAQEDGIDLTANLAETQQCISPSDFGFHNALQTKDGKLYFLDFEYAGWDDPAKMVGDFFSQLQIPAPAEYFNTFVCQVMVPFPEPEQLIKRAKLLRAVYQVKWCCIALNIFIPVNLARRQFAHPELNVVELKRTQLQKAESLLQKLGTPYG